MPLDSGTALSNLKLFDMPWGGFVTLLSMLVRMYEWVEYSKDHPTAQVEIFIVDNKS